MPFYYRIFSYRSDYKQTLFAFVLITTLFANLLGRDVVDNVSFEIYESSDMTQMSIYYTLNPENYESNYKIKVYISSDGGKTWFSPKTIIGDIGRQKISGSKVIAWDIFADRDELEGNIQVKVIAKNIMSFKRHISNATYISPSKKENNFLLHIYFSSAKTSFRNSTFKTKIKKGIINRKNGYSIGIRGHFLPSMVDMGISYEQLSEDGVDNNYAMNLIALYFSYSKPFFADKYEPITPFAGLGYQLSGISLSSLTVNGIKYEPCHSGDAIAGACYEGATGTSAFYIDLGIVINTPALHIAISNKLSLFDKRDWSRIELSIGFNYQP